MGSASRISGRCSGPERMSRDAVVGVRSSSGESVVGKTAMLAATGPSVDIPRATVTRPRAALALLVVGAVTYVYGISEARAAEEQPANEAKERTEVAEESAAMPEQEAPAASAEASSRTP